MFKFLVIILITASCSSKPKATLSFDTTSSSKKVLSLLKSFNISTKTPILFKKLDKKYAAICKKYDSKKLNIIHINEKVWNTLTKYQKKLVLVHEIGHCDKDLNHIKNLLPDGCPSSIMFPSIFSSNCFKKYEKKYVKEVFGD